MAKGEFEPLLAWLRENIHRHGRRYTAGQLCERATGKPLNADPLMRHLERRVRPAYGL
jgi:carboxypeptidase Taq